MFGEAFSYYVGMVGLFLVLLSMIGLVLWIFRPNSGKRYKKYGEIPLKDNDE
jgi:cbb3-type cytochrome oxidase subunit 3